MYIQNNIVCFDMFLTCLTLIYKNNSITHLFLCYNLLQSFCTNLILFFDKQYNDILQRDIENDFSKKKLFTNLYIIMNHLHCVISSLLIIQTSKIYFAIAGVVLVNLANLYSIIAILHDSINIHDETLYQQKIYFLLELSIMSIVISVMYNLTTDLSILYECIGFITMYILTLFIHKFSLLQFLQIYGSYITYRFISIEYILINNYIY